MQQNDGRFKMISEGEAEQARRAGKGSRILREDTEVTVRSTSDQAKGFHLESIGERFLRLRALAGHAFGVKVGEEVTIEGCSFVVRSKSRKILLLEGVPPETLPDER